MDAGSVRRLFAPDETLPAYGEVVWSWRLKVGVKLAEVIPLATVTRKPDRRGATVFYVDL